MQLKSIIQVFSKIKIKDFLLSLPLGLFLPLFIMTTSIGPNEARSNIMKWLDRIDPGKKIHPFIFYNIVDFLLHFSGLIISLYIIKALSIVILAFSRKFQNQSFESALVPGAIKFIEAKLILEYSHEKKTFVGRCEIQIENTSGKLISFLAITAGRINDVAFWHEKVKFCGYISPNSTTLLVSRTLHDLKMNESDVEKPWLYAVYEYDLRYKAHGETEFFRRSNRGVFFQVHNKRDIKPSGEIMSIPITTTFYDEVEE